MSEDILATPAGVTLGPLTLIPDGKARNFVLEMKAGYFHGFVIRNGDTVRGYVDRCAHMPIYMAFTRDDYLTPDGALIKCGWHGARYRIEDGVCIEGPCIGAALIPWPVTLKDGMIVTA